MGYVDKAVMAHLKSVLHSGFVGDCRLAIQITEADILRHEKPLSDFGVPDNASCVILACVRVSGTGEFMVFPIEGGFGCILERPANSMQLDNVSLAVINERIQYSLSVANDVFDIYVLGYWTSGQVLG